MKTTHLIATSALLVLIAGLATLAPRAATNSFEVGSDTRSTIADTTLLIGDVGDDAIDFTLATLRTEILDYATTTSTLATTSEFLLWHAGGEDSISWDNVLGSTYGQTEVRTWLTSANPSQAEIEAGAAALNIPALDASGDLVGTFELSDATNTALAANQIAADADGRLVIGDGSTQGGVWVSAATWASTDFSPAADTRYELARWSLSADRLAVASSVMLEYKGSWRAHNNFSTAYNTYIVLDVADNTGGTVSSTVNAGVGTMIITEAADSFTTTNTHWADAAMSNTLADAGGGLLKPGVTAGKYGGITRLTDATTQYLNQTGSPSASTRIDPSNTADLVAYLVWEDISGIGEFAVVEGRLTLTVK